MEYLSKQYKHIKSGRVLRAVKFDSPTTCQYYYRCEEGAFMLPPDIVEESCDYLDITCEFGPGFAKAAEESWKFSQQFAEYLRDVPRTPNYATMSDLFTVLDQVNARVDKLEKRIFPLQ